MSDLNPYASPTAPPTAQPPFDVGVGAWRHGSLLVIHQDVQLLGICVKTGRPATQWRLVKIRWSHPLIWPREYLHLWLPLCDRRAFWMGRGRRIAALGSVLLCAIVLSLLVASILLPGILQNGELVILVWGSGAVGGILLCWWFSLGIPLVFVRRKRKYFWLSGAHRQFLASLPNWPYGR
jgi:hypothetical protein